MSKLTELQAREIYWLTHNTNRSFSEIAECFGITKSSVQSIKERRNWKWLTEKGESEMVEVKYDKSHHAGGTPEARIANRLRNSGEGAKPSHIAKHGDGPTRTVTNVHNAGHYVDPSTAAHETGNPQEQEHAGAATVQSHFTGYKGGDE